MTAARRGADTLTGLLTGLLLAWSMLGVSMPTSCSPCRTSTAAAAGPIAVKAASNARWSCRAPVRTSSRSTPRSSGGVRSVAAINGGLPLPARSTTRHGPQ